MTTGTRRGFLGQLATLLCGIGLNPPRLQADQPDIERGVWRDRGDPGTLAAVIHVNGHLLGMCCSVNEELQAVEVDVGAFVDGKVSPVFCDGEAVSHKLILGNALKIYWDGKAPKPKSKGFMYYTGSGWINDDGKVVPMSTWSWVRIHEQVAGATIQAGQRVRTRNGRVFPVQSRVP